MAGISPVLWHRKHTTVRETTSAFSGRTGDGKQAWSHRGFPLCSPARLSSFWQKPCPALQASSSRMLVCCSPAPLCGGLSEGRTHPPSRPHPRIKNHNSNLGIFLPLLAPPKLSACSAHSTWTSLPCPSSPCENSHPQHVTNCYVSFLELSFSWHQLTTEQKCPLQGECGAAA